MLAGLIWDPLGHLHNYMIVMKFWLFELLFSEDRRTLNRKILKLNHFGFKFGFKSVKFAYLLVNYLGNIALFQWWVVITSLTFCHMTHIAITLSITLAKHQHASTVTLILGMAVCTELCWFSEVVCLFRSVTGSYRRRYSLSLCYFLICSLLGELSALILFSSFVHCVFVSKPPDSCETMVTPVQISTGTLLAQPWQQG